MNLIRAFTRETRYFRSSFQASRSAHSTGKRLVDPDEDAEVAGEPRHRREAAADEHAEAGLPVADRADERDAVDLRRVAAVRAGGDGDLVLARQVGVVGVAVEERRHGLGDRR